jgi:hypothetical protein
MIINFVTLALELMAISSLSIIVITMPHLKLFLPQGEDYGFDDDQLHRKN